MYLCGLLMFNISCLNSSSHVTKITNPSNTIQQISATTVIIYVLYEEMIDLEREMVYFIQ